jgi:hypothetical protein
MVVQLLFDPIFSGRLPDAESSAGVIRRPGPTISKITTGVMRFSRDHRDDVGIKGSSALSVRAQLGKQPRAVWQIVLPAALPQILTGLQVALPLSMIVAVVAEMLMGGYGPAAP